MNSEERLNSYKAALRTAWGYNDYNDWPIKFNSIMHLFVKEFAQGFLEDVNDIKRNCIPAEKICETFGNPARIFRIINPVVYGMKKMLMDITYQREIVLFMLDLVKFMKHGSEFNEDGKNIIINAHQVEKMREERNFYEADKKSTEIILKFCGITWAYTEAIFFRAHDVTKEIHGPYSFGGFKNLIIREYLNLRPYEIWKDIPLISANNVKIYTEYSEELKLHIDPYNHLFHFGGNFKENLRTYSIEADSQEVGIDYLESLIPLMLETIGAIHKWSQENNWRILTNRYADIYWYRKRPLRDLFDKDWKVPETVRKKIMEGNIDSRRIPKLTKEQIDRLISTII